MKKIVALLFTIFVFLQIANASEFDSAMQQNKPIVLYLYMNGCGACVAFEDLYSQTAQKYSNKYTFVKENYRNSEMAEKLKTDTLPSIYIINPKTRTAYRIKSSCFKKQACFEETLDNY